MGVAMTGRLHVPPKITACPHPPRGKGDHPHETGVRITNAPLIHQTPFFKETYFDEYTEIKAHPLLVAYTTSSAPRMSSSRRRAWFALGPGSIATLTWSSLVSTAVDEYEYVCAIDGPQFFKDRLRVDTPALTDTLSAVHTIHARYCRDGPDPIWASWLCCKCERRVDGVVKPPVVKCLFSAFPCRFDMRWIGAYK
jgi:hypothetical protein